MTELVAHKKHKTTNGDDPQARALQAAIADRTLLKIRLDRIVDDPKDNARGYGKLRLDLEQTDPGFLDSVRTQGVLQPVLVHEHADKPGYYVLEEGFCRVTAARMAGLVEIPAQVAGRAETTPLNARIRNLAENTHRKDLKPAELAFALSEIKRVAKESEGRHLSYGDIAKLTGMSEARVGNYLRCQEKLIPEILRAWRGEGGIALSKDEVEPFAAMKPEDQRVAWKAFLDDKNGQTDEDEEGKGGKARLGGKKPARMVKRVEVEEFLRTLKRQTFADAIETIDVLTESGMERTDAKHLSEEVRWAMVGLLEWVCGRRKKSPVTFVEADDGEDEE